LETESGAEYISPAHVRHIMRYVKACQFLKPGISVLDAACGTGYGTAIISKTNPVNGLDFNKDAIIEARKNYPKLFFLEADLLKFSSLPTIPYDAIVSIETIEHFARIDLDIFLKNMRCLVVENGPFIVRTPYCVNSGPSPVTKQHLYEFNLTELEMKLNDTGFAVQAIYPERHEGQAGRLGYCMVHCVAR
jgi:cyclopropane fatty-acyl-phospholipid synthase-like methyltransferase